MIPLNKFDLKALNKLMDTTDKEVLASAPQLLEWLKDKNWPVHSGVISRLIPLGDKLIEPISEVLRGNDSIWKSWIVVDLIGGFDCQTQTLYSDILNEVLLSASEDDYREGLIDSIEIQLSTLKGNL
jgi:hypothetical protein